jgi:hypothetical protein
VNVGEGKAEMVVEKDTIEVVEEVMEAVMETEMVAAVTKSFSQIC